MDKVARAVAEVRGSHGLLQVSTHSEEAQGLLNATVNLEAALRDLHQRLSLFRRIRRTELYDLRAVQLPARFSANDARPSAASSV